MLFDESYSHLFWGQKVKVKVRVTKHCRRVFALLWVLVSSSSFNLFSVFSLSVYINYFPAFCVLLPSTSHGINSLNSRKIKANNFKRFFFDVCRKNDQKRWKFMTILHIDNMRKKWRRHHLSSAATIDLVHAVPITSSLAHKGYTTAGLRLPQFPRRRQTESWPHAERRRHRPCASQSGQFTAGRAMTVIDKTWFQWSINDALTIEVPGHHVSSQICNLPVAWSLHLPFLLHLHRFTVMQYWKNFIHRDYHLYVHEYDLVCLLTFFKLLFFASYKWYNNTVN